METFGCLGFYGNEESERRNIYNQIGVYCTAMTSGEGCVMTMKGGTDKGRLYKEVVRE